MLLKTTKMTSFFLKKHSVNLEEYDNNYTKNYITFSSFKKHFIKLLTSHNIFEFVSFWKIDDFFFTKKNFILLNYYATKLQRLDIVRITDRDPIGTNKYLNILVFSKPSKQIFITFYSNKPKFIFTGGLMRLIINEKKKSSKKMYKVAISLLNLSSLFLKKKIFFDSCFLKLIKINAFKNKIISVFKKHGLHDRIIYIIMVNRIDFNAQKLKTRRSIKKYVKKRFK